MTKKLTLYGIFAALAIICGFIESLISLSFIAPGIKLGIANSLCLLLILNNDIKGSLAVNITRIILSSLLFSSPFTLLFSLTAGLASTCTSALLSRFKSVSAVGFGSAGAVVHNLTQLSVAGLIFGRSVWYYLPVLLIAAFISGGLIGSLCEIIFKKVKTKRK